MSERAQSWKAIRAVLKSGASLDSKLRQCLDIGNVHAALTGDFSLVHPQLQKEHNKSLQRLPLALVRAEAMRKDREKGQTSLFDL